MRLAFTEYQLALQTDVREFLARESPIEAVREREEKGQRRPGHEWEILATRGWLGQAIPTEYGGQGRGFTDACVVLEEAGRAIYPGPVLPAVALGAQSVLALGTEAQKRNYLPQLVGGKTLMTAAIDEPDVRPESPTTARKSRTGYVLRGEKVFVPAADIADFILVSARKTRVSAGRRSVFLVPTDARGVKVTVMGGLAPEFDCRVELEDVELPADSILGGARNGDGAAEALTRFGAVGLCVLMLGASQRIFEMTVEHAKQRVQFGRPIGSFQAVQHHCANMAIDVDSMRYATYVAAGKLGIAKDEANAVALAKAWCSLAAERVLALAHQVHAGFGFLRDHPLHMYSRRIKVWTLAHGSAQDQIEVLAAGLDQVSIA